jgi:hypothetical protein
MAKRVWELMQRYAFGLVLGQILSQELRRNMGSRPPAVAKGHVLFSASAVSVNYFDLQVVQVHFFEAKVQNPGREEIHVFRAP